MASTRMAEVVDRLKTVFGDATGLQVVDGPLLGQLMREAVVVGYAPESWGYVAQVSRQDGFGRPRLVEEWSVTSLLTVSSGDTGVAVLRIRVAGLLAAIDEAVRDDHVNAVWESASLAGEVRWQPSQESSGAHLAVVFSVDGWGYL